MKRTLFGVFKGMSSMSLIYLGEVIIGLCIVCIGFLLPDIIGYYILIGGVIISLLGFNLFCESMKMKSDKDRGKGVFWRFDMGVMLGAVLMINPYDDYIGEVLKIIGLILWVITIYAYRKKKMSKH